MDNQISNIRLFQLIKNKTDETIALEAVKSLLSTIKGEVNTETIAAIKDAKAELRDETNDVKIEVTEKISDLKLELNSKISDLKLELNEKFNELKLEFNDKINLLRVEFTDKINAAKIQTILWIVGMSIVQLLARYFFR